MKKQLFLTTLAIALMSATIWFTACQKDSSSTEPAITDQIATDRTPGDSKVYPPGAHPFGKSITEWTVGWMQEFMTDDCAHNGWLNPDNVLFHQSGPVYFMAGISSYGATANITVPHGKAILFPLVNFLNDHPCPDQNFQPDPGQSMEDFLRDGSESFWGITDYMALIENLSVSVDGSPVSNMPDYLFITDLFYFTGNPDLATCFDGCITGESQPAVAGGYYIMLKPLSKGTHTVHYHSEIPIWGAQQDATYNITVE